MTTALHTASRASRSEAGHRGQRIESPERHDKVSRARIRTILKINELEAHLRPNAEAIDGLLRRSAGYRSYRARRNGTLVPINVLEQQELREDIPGPSPERPRLTCDQPTSA